MIVYGMCPPSQLHSTTRIYQTDPELEHHFMRGTVTEVIWGNNMHEVMLSWAEDWEDEGLE
jgi:hypothetical protein